MGFLNVTENVLSYGTLGFKNVTKYFQESFDQY